MKESYGEGRSEPTPAPSHALAPARAQRSVDRGTCGPAIESRSELFLGAQAIGAAEGNTECAVTREAHEDLARSETLRTHGNLLHGNREILRSSAGGAADRDGKPKGVSRR